MQNNLFFNLVLVGTLGTVGLGGCTVAPDTQTQVEGIRTTKVIEEGTLIASDYDGDGLDEYSIGNQSIKRASGSGHIDKIGKICTFTLVQSNVDDPINWGILTASNCK